MDLLAAPERSRSGLSVVFERSRSAIDIRGPRLVPLTTTFAWVLLPALFGVVFATIDIICVTNILSDPIPSGLGLAVCGPMLYWCCRMMMDSLRSKEYVGTRISSNGIMTVRRNAYQTFEERIPNRLLQSICIVPTVRDRMLVVAVSANYGSLHPIGVFTESEIADIAGELAQLVHLPCVFAAIDQLPVDDLKPPFSILVDSKLAGQARIAVPMVIFDDASRVVSFKRSPAPEIPFEKTGPFTVECTVNGDFVPGANRDKNHYDYTFRLSMCPRDSEPVVLAVCTSQEKKATDHSAARANAEWIADFYKRVVAASSHVRLTTR